MAAIALFAMLMMVAAVAFFTMLVVMAAVTMLIVLMLGFAVEIHGRPRPCHGGFVFEMPFHKFWLPAHAQRQLHGAERRNLLHHPLAGPRRIAGRAVDEMEQQAVVAATRHEIQPDRRVDDHRLLREQAVHQLLHELARFGIAVELVVAADVRRHEGDRPVAMPFENRHGIIRQFFIAQRTAA